MSRPELSPSELAAEWEAVTRRWTQVLEFECNQPEHFNTNRGRSEYIKSLAGLTYFLDYIRTVPTSNLLVDIGAGNTKGIFRISRDPSLGKDLDCMATGLTLDPGRARYLGPDRFRRTPVEVMEGFEDNSIAGMLAVASIPYSASPEITVSRIDDLLAPGGGIKANFRSVEKDMDKPFGLMARHDEFSARFRRLGYDVGVVENGEVDVVLAIKPGNTTGVSAQELADKDKKEHDEFWARVYEMHADLKKLGP